MRKYRAIKNYKEAKVGDIVELCITKYRVKRSVPCYELVDEKGLCRSPRVYFEVDEVYLGDNFESISHYKATAEPLANYICQMIVDQKWTKKYIQEYGPRIIGSEIAGALVHLELEILVLENYWKRRKEMRDANREGNEFVQATFHFWFYSLPLLRSASFLIVVDYI